MCHFIQSSYNLLYRERACISQDRTGLAAVADKPQIALTSNNQGLFLPLLCAYCLFCKVCVLISGPGQKEQPLMVTNGKEKAAIHILAPKTSG